LTTLTLASYYLIRFDKVNDKVTIFNMVLG
jgi:hypothetical protein